VKLQSGDVLTLEGHPDGAEPAPIDYIEIVPEARGVAENPHP
jgi:hypothetical protein